MRYVKIEKLKTIFFDDLEKIKEIKYASSEADTSAIREKDIKDGIIELGWHFYERIEYISERTVHAPSDSRQTETFSTFGQAYRYMQTGAKITKVRVSLSIALEYASQTDADLDRNGMRPDLVIAIYCLETGRQKCVKSWLAQEKHNAKDFELQDIYD